MQRADGKLVRAIGPNRKTALFGIEPQFETSALQLFAILVAQERHQKLAAQILRIGLPVDVEPSGVVGVLTPFQHVQP